MTRLILVLVAIVFGASLARAGAEATHASVFLEDMTWTELRDAQAAGKDTIIIPVGGTEQNGPVMAIGKHNVRVKVMAGRIAEGLGNALVAPVVAYVPEGNISPPTEHMRFPGTITVPDDVFEKVLDSAAKSLAAHGFKDIVLIGDHGGYQRDLAIVADRLNHEWAGSPVRAHFIEEYYRSSIGPYAQALLGHGARQAEIGTHAGLADTSLMLAVDPKLVRADKLAGANNLGAADGVYGGEPSHASAEFGQLGVDLIVQRTIEAIHKATMRR